MNQAPAPSSSSSSVPQQKKVRRKTSQSDLFGVFQKGGPNSVPQPTTKGTAKKLVELFFLASSDKLVRSAYLKKALKVRPKKVAERFFSRERMRRVLFVYVKGPGHDVGPAGRTRWLFHWPKIQNISFRWPKFQLIKRRAATRGRDVAP